ncbi:hypothetical protein BV25DRAFT_1813365, partial [Artomyces pyxidatus]
SFKRYDAAHDVCYNPERLFAEAKLMVGDIRRAFQDIIPQSTLRKQVWQTEAESIEAEKLPQTVIGLVGATGSGKSTLLNALLDDRIVPTSGMDACTSIVTDVSYHDDSTIKADIGFISEAEWKETIVDVLEDLQYLSDKQRRSFEKTSVAWSKVHAVYPSLTTEEIAKMTVNDILAHEPRCCLMLGGQKTVVSSDSKSFALQIMEVIGPGSGFAAPAPAAPAFEELFQGAFDFDELMEHLSYPPTGYNQPPTTKGPTEPVHEAGSLWPLICKLSIKCNAPVLSTGAVFVDLPGFADDVAARNNIAKAYIAKCDRIWIFAPITRAVNDGLARKLLSEEVRRQLQSEYPILLETHGSTQTDNISCSEIVGRLGLKTEPTFREIEGRLLDCGYNLEGRRRGRREIKARTQGQYLRLVRIQALRQEIERLRLERAVPSSQLALLQSGSESEFLSIIKKRSVPAGDDALGVQKRRRVQGEGSDAAAEILYESSGKLTPQSLGTIVAAYDGKIQHRSEALEVLLKLDAENEHQCQTLEENTRIAQRDKDAFCSLKRSEYTRDKLQAEFRQEIMEADGQSEYTGFGALPGSIAGSSSVENPPVTDLPVFCCSSRDYLRLKGLATGDGRASCFSDIEQTEIPALRSWSLDITTAARERAVTKLLARLNAFAKSIQQYLGIADEGGTAGQAALKMRWGAKTVVAGRSKASRSSAGLANQYIFVPEKPKRGELLQTDSSDALEYAWHQLVADKGGYHSEFARIMNDHVSALRNRFQRKLATVLEAGARSASDGSLQFLDDFAQSMHWTSFRATVRRNGIFKRDLNDEIASPIVEGATAAWTKLFSKDMFVTFELEILGAIDGLLHKIKTSSPPGHLPQVQSQASLCRTSAILLLRQIVEEARQTLTAVQREASRSSAPYIKASLSGGYELAQAEQGTGAGSTVRERTAFRDFVKKNCEDIFQGGARAMLAALDAGADTTAMEQPLRDLARKVEVDMAVLWEEVTADVAMLEARAVSDAVLTEVLRQIEFWKIARTSALGASPSQDPSTSSVSASTSV